MEQPMMTVYVKLFATLRRHFPELGIGEAMAVQLPADSTVKQLLQELSLEDEHVKIIFVNGITRKESYRLRQGDEVGIFPPVGGG
jgi:molybdopterin converting factor small subunit